MPWRLRCPVRSRYVTATLDVRALLHSWPLFFGPVTRLPARRREPVYTQISCFWAQVSENFLPDNLESDLSSSGFCGRATFTRHIHMFWAKGRKSITIRTTRTTVSFSQLFKLKDLDDIQPAGDYLLDTDEELIEGLSRLAYRSATCPSPAVTRSASAYPPAGSAIVTPSSSKATCRGSAIHAFPAMK